MSLLPAVRSTREIVDNQETNKMFSMDKQKQPFNRKVTHEGYSLDDAAITKQKRSIPTAQENSQESMVNSDQLSKDSKTIRDKRYPQINSRHDSTLTDESTIAPNRKREVDISKMTPQLPDPSEEISQLDGDATKQSKRSIPTKVALDVVDATKALNDDSNTKTLIDMSH